MIATLEWTHNLSIMQQSVLLSAIRGPDGIPKRHKCKNLIKYYRRCVLLSAFEKMDLSSNPYSDGGGSFTGPIEYNLDKAIDDFMNSRDELPLHYVTHMMHAFQILGYKFPDFKIRKIWNDVYVRMVNCFHLYPETEYEMDRRLGDIKADWEARSDPTMTCSD